MSAVFHKRESHRLMALLIVACALGLPSYAHTEEGLIEGSSSVNSTGTSENIPKPKKDLPYPPPYYGYGYHNSAYPISVGVPTEANISQTQLPLQFTHRPSAASSPNGNHSPPFGTAAPLTENFVKGLETCVNSIRRGLDYFSASKKKFDDTRDYVLSSMANVPNDESGLPQAMPTQVEKILQPRKVENTSDMKDIEAALLMLKRFEKDLAAADGPVYRHEAMLACNQASAKVYDLAKKSDRLELATQSYGVVTHANTRAALTILKVNSRWAQLRTPLAQDFNASMQMLNSEFPSERDPAEADSYGHLNKHGLTYEEFLGLRNYTASGYSDVNNILRNPASPQNVSRVPKLQAYLDSTDAGLSKMPNYVGIVNRGASLPESAVAQHSVGAVVEYPAFTSTSTANGFSGMHHFVIQSYTGKYVNSYSFCNGEQEVLFRPGAKFRVLQIEEGASESSFGATKTFYMEEVAE